MEKKVLVRILQTGSEEVVSEAYYERYKNEGVVLIREYKEEAPKTTAKKKEE